MKIVRNQTKQTMSVGDLDPGDIFMDSDLDIYIKTDSDVGGYDTCICLTNGSRVSLNSYECQVTSLPNAVLYLNNPDDSSKGTNE